MRKYILTLVLTVIAFQGSYAQELQKPTEGKALVYIARTSGLGAAINFKYFVDSTFIGKFNGRNYIIREFDPGYHLLWAAAENREYIEAELEANKIYIIEAIPQMGAIKARVGFNPVKPDDAKAKNRFNKLIAKKSPKMIDQQKIEAENAKLQYFIENGLDRYDKIKGTSKVKKLDSDENYN